MQTGKVIFRALVLFAFLTISKVSFAAPLYAPGDTLNPSCLPTDPDCTVTTVSALLTQENVYTALQRFNANASTTALTVTGNTYFPGSGIWNSSGNVGIGTLSPGAKLQIDGNGVSLNPDLFINSTVGGAVVKLKHQSSTNGWLITQGYNTNDDLAFSQSSSVRMYLSDTGTVGIGTTTPNTTLTVSSSQANGINLSYDTSAPTNSGRQFFTNYSSSYSIYNSNGTFNLRYGATPGSSSGTAGFVMDSSGNVGIGTTTPQNKLHVSNGFSGVLPLAGTVLTVEDDTTAYLSLLTPSANRSGLLFGNSVSNTSGGIIYNDTTSATANNMQFRVNGNSTKMTIQSDGNVGIGTTSPGALLHVRGSGSTPAIFERTSSSVYNQFMSDGVSRGYIGWVNLGDTGLGFLNAAGNAARLLVTDSGNVGIGTTSPNAKLNVYSGASGVNPPLISGISIENNNDTGLSILTPDSFQSYITFGNTSDSNAVQLVWDPVTDLFDIGLANTGADLRFMTGNNVEAVRILDTGNVGIGTTTPYAKLSVKGAGSTTGVNFQTTNSSDSPLFTILDSGNVGIGTVSPLSKLQIGSQTSTPTATPDTISLGATYGNTVANSYKLKLYDSGTTADDYAWGISANQMNFKVPTSASFHWYNTTTERMVIDSTGNVGIGTTSPANLFSVQKTAQTTTAEELAYFSVSDSIGYLKIKNGSEGNTAFAPVINGYYSGSTFPGIELRADAVTDSGTVPLMAFNSLASGSTVGTRPLFQWQNNGSAKMTMDKSGNVGIGTTSPGYKLEVVGGSGGVDTSIFSIQSFSNTVNTGSTMRFVNSVSSANVFSSGEIGVIRRSSGADMQFRVGDGSIMNTWMTLIGSTGNVGIGTTIPGGPFQVVSGTGSTTIGTIATGYGGIGFANTVTATNYSLGGEGVGTFLNRPTGGTMYFREGNVNQMIILPTSGNVGIGSTTPSHKLTVNGNSYFAGAVLATSTVKFSGLATNAAANALCIDASGNLTTAAVAACSGVSSQRYKHDINDIDLGLSKLLLMRPVSFKYNEGYGDNGKSTQFGLIAEDIYSIDPRLTIVGEDGLPTTVRYDLLTPILIKSIKELNEKIDRISTTTITTIVETRNATTTKTKGITIYDTETDLPYCIKIVRGVNITEPGECGTVAPVQSSAVIVQPEPTVTSTPTPTPAPTETPTPSPTEEPTSTPTVTPEPEPTETPAPAPVETPVVVEETPPPTETPAEVPVVEPAP